MVKRYELMNYQGLVGLTDSSKGDYVKYDYYAALKSELDALREQVRWRDVREELPELNVECLWLDSNNTMYSDIQVHIDCLTKSTIHGNVCCAVNYLHNYTHWMPLPTPPTSQSNKD